MKYLLYIVIIPGLIVAAFLWGRMYEMTRQRVKTPATVDLLTDTEKACLRGLARIGNATHDEAARLCNSTPQVPKSTRSNSSL